MKRSSYTLFRIELRFFYDQKSGLQERKKEMEETKKFRHTECGFNPLERMTVAVNDAGQILVDTLKSQGGSFLLNREDASVVYVPKLKLTLNDYKDWWNSAYPDGRIERSSEIHTVKATTWVQNGDVKTPLEYPYN